jgi:hypothetical protein
LKKISFLTAFAVLLVTASFAFAHEPVKLSGYLMDSMCMLEHAKDNAETATKATAEHTKDCALMPDCIKSGYGVFSDGKYYAFDEKGNQLAKSIFEKSKKTDHFKVTVEGLKHGDKILVSKITEE